MLINLPKLEDKQVSDVSIQGLHLEATVQTDCQTMIHRANLAHCLAL